MLVIRDSGPRVELRLAPENDERDKTINNLKAQIAELQKIQPVLELSVTDQTGQPIQRLEPTVMDYAPPSGKELEALMEPTLSGHLSNSGPLTG